MPTLPKFTLPTITEIYTSYITSASDWRRDHLGASLIGNDCERKLWYTFRWCSNPKFDGRVLRLFDTGNIQETRLIRDLRNIGCVVYDRDPDTGKQISFSEFGGHFGGSVDAIANGFQESQRWHIVECKTAGSKAFSTIKKNGVQFAKPEHYAQMQMYMKWAELERAYYLCVCKDTDEIYGERIYYNKDIANTLSEKARRIIFSERPLEKITESESDFRCRYCEHKSVCHSKRLPEINCRTCCHSDAEPNGMWYCCRNKNSRVQIDCKFQRLIHNCHVFLPYFIPIDATDADVDHGSISYGNITNGENGILSINMQEAIDGTNEIT